MNFEGSLFLLLTASVTASVQGFLISGFPVPIRITHYFIARSSLGDDQDPDPDEKANCYKQPQFSDSFRKYIETVEDSFPMNDDEGVDCTGEPSMDPSRMVMDNGLDSEYLNDLN
mmetsp:Transcript_18938/g.28076  ORF Transcript_18938/g.28076 Transcript_18938/m.28076 type:complete len:115 (+) Transcript_18938:110-454(+)